MTAACASRQAPVDVQDGDCRGPHVAMEEGEARGAGGTGVGGVLLPAPTARDGRRATATARDLGVPLGNEAKTTSNYSNDQGANCGILPAVVQTSGYIAELVRRI
jgi:hypothetical protein